MAFSKELEEIIDAALADGVLTDKERSVLHKKASLEGVDPDEIDVVIEGRLAKMKREVDWLKPEPPASEKRGNIVKCPNCGAVVEAGAASCKECGYVFVNVSSNRYSEKLSAKLEEFLHKEYKYESDRGEAMANVIRNFPVPTSKEDLMEFISSMLPKTFQTTSNENEAAHYLPTAYQSKVEECVLKAKVAFPDDSQLQSLIDNVEKSKKKRFMSKISHSTGFWITVFLVLDILALALFAFWDTKSNDEKKEQIELSIKAESDSLSKVVSELPVPTKKNIAECKNKVLQLTWTPVNCKSSDLDEDDVLALEQMQENSVKAFVTIKNAYISQINSLHIGNPIPEDSYENYVTLDY